VQFFVTFSIVDSNTCSNKEGKCRGCDELDDLDECDECGDRDGCGDCSGCSGCGNNDMFIFL
jgi:hypothetical protein